MHVRGGDLRRADLEAHELLAAAGALALAPRVRVRFSCLPSPSGSSCRCRSRRRRRHLGRKLRDRQVDRSSAASGVSAGASNSQSESPSLRSTASCGRTRARASRSTALVGRLGVGQLVDGLRRGSGSNAGSGDRCRLRARGRLERSARAQTSARARTRARGPIRLRARRSAGTPARARTSARTTRLGLGGRQSTGSGARSGSGATSRCGAGVWTGCQPGARQSSAGCSATGSGSTTGATLLECGATGSTARGAVVLDDSVARGQVPRRRRRSTTSSDSGVCFLRPNESSRFQIDGRSSAAGVLRLLVERCRLLPRRPDLVLDGGAPRGPTTSSSLVRFLRPNDISRFQIDWRSAGVSVSSSSTGVVSSGSRGLASSLDRLILLTAERQLALPDRRAVAGHGLDVLLRAPACTLVAPGVPRQVVAVDRKGHRDQPPATRRPEPVGAARRSSMPTSWSARVERVSASSRVITVRRTRSASACSIVCIPRFVPVCM